MNKKNHPIQQSLWQNVERDVSTRTIVGSIQRLWKKEYIFRLEIRTCVMHSVHNHSFGVNFKLVVI